MISFKKTAVAIFALLALPAMGEAAVRGHATTDVNSRSGPGADTARATAAVSTALSI